MLSAPVALTASHIPGAFTLSALAGWNQTREDWRMILELSDACYGIEVDGQLVATATLVCYGRYGRRLGWLGMVLTHPDFRRLGFARVLVDRAMRQAKTLGIRTVKLDATAEGQPLYESFGFQPDQSVERWEQQPQAGPPPAFAPHNALPSGLDADYPHEVLARLAVNGDALVKPDGYVLHRPGRLRRYLGPCVAKNPTVARSLIGEAVSLYPDTGWFWDLLPANRHAVAIAKELGFERVRTLTRMSWGRELPTSDDRIFAIAGLELG